MRAQRPRPSTKSNPSDVESRIRAAALDLFAEKGFTATTTAEIARRAGVAEKTIFANFQSKSALFEETLTPATVDLLVPDVTDVSAAVFEEPATLRDFLSKLVLNRVEVLRRHPTKFKLIVQELLLRPDRARRYIADLDPKFHHAVERALRRLQSQGQLRKMPMARLHRTVVSAIFGYAITSLLIWPDRKWDDESEIAATVDILVDGLGVPKS